MKLIKIALPLLLIMGSAQLALAQDSYGTAELQEGTLIVMRGGEALRFDTAGEEVPVFVGDVLRVGIASRVALRTIEKTTISMGANAVFQVKPFQVQEKQGFARVLFGRFRSVIKGLVDGEEVNTKTATAVIGVKGTENLVAVTPSGKTSLVGLESVTTLQGQIGGEQNIGPGLVSLVVNDRDATTVVEAPQEMMESVQSDNLNAPPSNSPEAVILPNQEELVESGAITPEQLADVDNEASIEEVIPSDEVDRVVAESNLDDVKENLYRADVEIQFQR